MYLFCTCLVATAPKSVEEPESSKKPPDELRIKALDSLIGAPTTPTSDQRKFAFDYILEDI